MSNPIFTFHVNPYHAIQGNRQYIIDSLKANGQSHLIERFERQVREQMLTEVIHEDQKNNLL